jgi:Arc/MetJ family transcription regulator
MRTNIVLEDQLVERALRLAPVKTKRALIHLALDEFVRNRSRKDLRELRGRVSFAPDYDYKKARRSRHE